MGVSQCSVAKGAPMMENRRTGNKDSQNKIVCGGSQLIGLEESAAGVKPQTFRGLVESGWHKGALT